MLSHINKGVSVLGNYSKPFNENIVTKMVLADLYCNKHQINFRNKVVLDVKTDLVLLPFNCPHCNAEILQEREARLINKQQEEANLLARTKQIEAELMQEEMRDKLLASGLSPSQIDFTPDDRDSFVKYKDMLDNIDSTYILRGKSGSGKSVFCVEAIKRNLDKNPIYIDCLDFVELVKNKQNYKIQSIKNKLADSKLIIFDSAEHISKIDPDTIESIVNAGDKNGAKFIFSANISTDSKGYVDFTKQFSARVQRILFDYGESLLF